jgi:hypothetical protein
MILHYQLPNFQSTTDVIMNSALLPFHDQPL